MIAWALLLVPALAGLAAFAVRSHAVRRSLLLLAATVHLLLVVAAWAGVGTAGGPSWLGLDAPGLLFLGISSVLFLAASVYATGYLATESGARRTDSEEGLAFLNQPEAVFTGCLLLFDATMTLVCLSRHFGLLWVAIEGTTLASAPLIYYHRHHRSLEATWKYLMICSVGIALALLGTFFLAVAAAHGGHTGSLMLDELLASTAAFQPVWLRAAFVFLLVGYGTKAGLAPLHTWLPDAHSESPSLVSALLSGALLNCALLGILRAFQVCAHAGEAAFAQPLLIGFGLTSMVVAAAFVLGQPDYKRMLAYSSVEHMGVIALGIGIGGAAAATGAMLHAVSHSLTKASLFLVSGNLLAAYRTKETARVRGALRALPVSGALWLTGALVITGMPPAGLFLSKLTILRAAFERGYAAVAVAALALFAVVFVGMNVLVLRMTQGEPDAGSAPERARERWATLAPPLLLAGLVVLLGVIVPGWLQELLGAAGACFAGGN